MSRANDHDGWTRPEAGRHADAAIKSTRGLEKAYPDAISALTESSEPAGRVVLAAEIHRRSDSLGDAIIGVSHRVWFPVLEEE